MSSKLLLGLLGLILNLKDKINILTHSLNDCYKLEFYLECKNVLRKYRWHLRILCNLQIAFFLQENRKCVFHLYLFIPIWDTNIGIPTIPFEHICLGYYVHSK